jgi:hypothetical protein
MIMKPLRPGIQTVEAADSAPATTGPTPTRSGVSTSLMTLMRMTVEPSTSTDHAGGV